MSIVVTLEKAFETAKSENIREALELEALVTSASSDETSAESTTVTTSTETYAESTADESKGAKNEREYMTWWWHVGIFYQPHLRYCFQTLSERRNRKRKRSSGVYATSCASLEIWRSVRSAR